MAEALNQVKDWFLNTIGLENMTLFAFVMSVIYLVSLFTRPAVKCISGFRADRRPIKYRS